MDGSHLKKEFFLDELRKFLQRNRSQSDLKSILNKIFKTLLPRTFLVDLLKLLPNARFTQDVKRFTTLLLRLRMDEGNLSEAIADLIPPMTELRKLQEELNDGMTRLNELNMRQVLIISGSDPELRIRQAELNTFVMAASTTSSMAELISLHSELANFQTDLNNRIKPPTQERNNVQNVIENFMRPNDLWLNDILMGDDLVVLNPQNDRQAEVADIIRAVGDQNDPAEPNARAQERDERNNAPVAAANAARRFRIRRLEQNRHILARMRIERVQGQNEGNNRQGNVGQQVFIGLDALLNDAIVRNNRQGAMANFAARAAGVHNLAADQRIVVRQVIANDGGNNRQEAVADEAPSRPEQPALQVEMPKFQELLKSHIRRLELIERSNQRGGSMPLITGGRVQKVKMLNNLRRLNDLNSQRVEIVAAMASTAKLQTLQSELNEIRTARKRVLKPLKLIDRKDKRRKNDAMRRKTIRNAQIDVNRRNNPKSTEWNPLHEYFTPKIQKELIKRQELEKNLARRILYELINHTNRQNQKNELKEIV